MTRVNAWAFAEPRVLDDNGDPISGGGAYIYQAGTTTEIAVTSDLDGNTSVTQPITADSAGRLADSYILPQSFKVVYVDASDTVLQTIDNIEVASGTFVYDTYALLTAATAFHRRKPISRRSAITHAATAAGPTTCGLHRNRLTTSRTR